METKMEKRYVMLWNGGLYHNFDGLNVFTLNEVRNEFNRMLGGELTASTTFSHATDLDDEPEVTDLEELLTAMIEAGNYGSPYFIFGEELAERGGDFVQASLVSLEING
jgi:hypothetical protein